LLVMIDEFTRECLAIRVARRLNSAHVIVRSAGTCEIGQRRGDDGSTSEAVARVGRHQAIVYRAGKSMGERILRIVQRETAGRVFEWGDFLFAQGSQSGD
jgi:hypothetical protein